MKISKLLKVAIAALLSVSCLASSAFAADTVVVKEYITSLGLDYSKEQGIISSTIEYGEATEGSIVRYYNNYVKEWELNKTSGVLTIYGSGKMRDWTGLWGDLPNWYSYGSYIKSVNFTGIITHIGSRAFLDSALTSFTIQPSVTSIGDSAFSNCKNLTSITFPENVKSIGEETFRDCKSLTEITIPSTVEAVGARAFWGCNGITSLTLKDGIQSIGDGCFSACTHLEEVTVPGSIGTISKEMFSGCSKLGKVTVKEGITAINENAFDSDQELSDVSLPSTLKSIGDCAFNYCKGLANITLPEGLQTIGKQAFISCYGLKRINIPSTVTAIGGNAFYCTGSIERVDITSIDAWCKIDFDLSGNPFQENSASLYLNDTLATTITIPDTVTTIKPYCFCGFRFLQSIIFPKKINAIGERAFSNCENLGDFILPDGVETIGESAFYGCQNLDNIIIPEGVTSIDVGAFDYCDFTSVTMPSTLKYVGNKAFSGRWDKSSIHVNDLAAWCNVTLESESSSPLRGNGKFYVGEELVTSLHIPNGVEMVKPYHFVNAASITSVVVPKSVTTISTQAFNGCDNITDIYYSESADKWAEIEIGSNNGSFSKAILRTDYAQGKYSLAFSKNSDNDYVGNLPNSISTTGECTIPNITPSRSGYEFLGWSFNKLATAPAYRINDTVNVSEDCTLYAIWRANKAYGINAIRIMSASGTELSEVPNDSFVAEVDFTNYSGSGRPTLILGFYDNKGSLVEARYLTANLMRGQKISLGTSVNNTNGNISEIKAFLLESIGSLEPLCPSRTLGE